MSATSGMYLLTGSVSASLPSSTSIIAATLVTGLVIEAIQKIASGLSGILPATVIGADGLEVGELAVACDGNDSARKGAPVLISASYQGGDARQPAGREAGADRVRDGQALRQSGRRQPEKSCRTAPAERRSTVMVRMYSLPTSSGRYLIAADIRPILSARNGFPECHARPPRSADKE